MYIEEKQIDDWNSKIGINCNNQGRGEGFENCVLVIIVQYFLEGYFL